MTTASRSGSVTSGDSFFPPISRDELIDRITGSPQTSNIVAGAVQVSLACSAAIIMTNNPEVAKDLQGAASVLSIGRSIHENMSAISLGKTTAFNKSTPLKFVKDCLHGAGVLWSVTSLINKVYQSVVKSALFHIPVLNVVFSSVTIASCGIDTYLAVGELVEISGKVSKVMGGHSIIGDHSTEIDKELQKLDSEQDANKAKELLTKAWKTYDERTHNLKYLRKETITKSLRIAMNILIIAMSVLSICALFAVGGPLAAAGIAAALVVLQSTVVTLSISSYVFKILWPEEIKPTLKTIQVLV